MVVKWYVKIIWLKYFVIICDSRFINLFRNFEYEYEGEQNVEGKYVIF